MSKDNNARALTHHDFTKFLGLLSHHQRENLTYELAKLRAKQMNDITQARKSDANFEPSAEHNSQTAWLEEINDVLEAVKLEAGPAPIEEPTAADAAIQAGVKHED